MKGKKTMTTAETGLPELPEGQWWRIGEIDSEYEDGTRRYGTGGWASSSSPGKLSAVQIMERRHVAVIEETPIYGTHWWNKGSVVGYDERPVTQLKEVAILTRLFTGYRTTRREDIPEHAVSAGSGGPSGGPPDYYHYSYHENADGARASAEMMIEEYEEIVKQERAWRIAEEAKKRAKAELFGDYPPKTLPARALVGVGVGGSDD
jgi:hypothetical protein